MNSYIKRLNERKRRKVNEGKVSTEQFTELIKEYLYNKSTKYDEEEMALIEGIQDAIEEMGFEPDDEQEMAIVDVVQSQIDEAIDKAIESISQKLSGIIRVEARKVMLKK